MELFFEQTVINENMSPDARRIGFLRMLSSVANIILAILIFIAVLALMIDFTNVVFVSIVAVVLLSPFVIAKVIVLKKLEAYLVQYDYVLNGKQLKIIKVYKTRKLIFQTDLDSFDYYGNVNDESFEKYERLPQIKRVVAVCNFNSDSIGYVYILSGDTKHLLLWEPSAEMMISIKRTVPRLAIKCSSEFS